MLSLPLESRRLLVAASVGACVGVLVARIWRPRRFRAPVPYKSLVGVLGGLGPAASALLTQLITNELVDSASSDADHVPYLMFCNPCLPNSRAASIGQGPSPLPGITESFRCLAAAGATSVCVCCNTAHPYARQAAVDACVPFIDMVVLTAESALQRLLAQRAASGRAEATPARQPLVSSTANAAYHESQAELAQQEAKFRQELNEHLFTIGLLATDGTLQMRLYQNALDEAAARLGARVRVLVADDPAIAQRAITAIKAGELVDTAVRVHGEAMKLVERGADCVVLGCTELPVVLNETSYPEFAKPIVSPVHVLAATIARETKTSRI